MADIGMTYKLSLEKGTSIEVVENASPVRICRNLEKLDSPPPKVYLVYEYDWEDNLADIWVTQNPRFLQKKLSSQKLHFWRAHKKMAIGAKQRVECHRIIHF